MSTKNRFKVPAKIWRKWTEVGRKAFNELYLSMADQRVYTHPKAPQLPPKQWKTTAWNAAWMAASLVSEGSRARDYRVETLRC